MNAMNFGWEDPNSYSMGSTIGAFGNGLNTGAARASSAMGMNTGTPLQANNPSTFMPPTTGAAAPGAAPGGGGIFGGGGNGGFMNGFANLAQGLGGLGQLYIGLKSLGIAKDQLAFSKEAYGTNLRNQRQSYNTALEDRVRSRHVAEGRGSAETDAYLSQNKL